MSSVRPAPSGLLCVAYLSPILSLCFGMVAPFHGEAMPAKSYTHDNNVLNFFLRNNPGSLTAPTTVYVGLLTVAPANPGATGTEVANANGYARVAVTFGAPVNGATSNTATVTFPAATGSSWGTVVAAAIYDNATYGTGTLLYYGTLGTSKFIDDGDTASFAAGTLTVTEQ